MGLDERLTATEREELAATYGDRAVAALREAVEKSAVEVAQMNVDPRLEPLPRREDFRRVLHVR